MLDVFPASLRNPRNPAPGLTCAKPGARLRSSYSRMSESNTHTPTESRETVNLSEIRGISCSEATVCRFLTRLFREAQKNNLRQTVRPLACEGTRWPATDSQRVYGSRSSLDSKDASRWDQSRGWEMRCRNDHPGKGAKTIHEVSRPREQGNPPVDQTTGKREARVTPKPLPLKLRSRRARARFRRRERRRLARSKRVKEHRAFACAKARAALTRAAWERREQRSGR